MAECGVMVGSGSVSYPCDLDLPLPHEGPHRAKELPRSVAERKRWESGEEARRTLAQFQGPAQTTAERYTENPTPVPGTVVAGLRACDPCSNQEHFKCIQTPEVVAVTYHGKEGFEVLCSCFRTNPAAHGLTDEMLMVVTDKLGQVKSAAPPVPTEPVVEPVPEPEPVIEQPEPIKQREGDQPLPQINEEEFVQDRIIVDLLALNAEGKLADDVTDFLIDQMTESKEIGTKRYGTPLQTFNGRDTLQDATDEARDLFVYLNALILARSVDREKFIEVAGLALVNHVKAGGETDSVSIATVVVDTILDATGGVVG